MRNRRRSSSVAQLLGERGARRLGRDQQAALEVLDAGDVAVQPHGAAEVLGERGAQPRVVPAVAVLAVRRRDHRVRRALRLEPGVRRERVRRAPCEQPRRLARGERPPLALVLVQDGVGAVAAGAAGVDAHRPHALPAHRLDRPAPHLEHRPSGMTSKLASPAVDLAELIRTRRTHKAYAPEPVDRATLDELFELARWAPNHNLTNPWRFRVLGPDALERLKAAAGPEAAAKLDRAPTLVAASVVQGDDPVDDEEDRDAAACACYIVLLAAHDRGLGGYWRTPGRAAHAGGPRGLRDPRRRGGARPAAPRRGPRRQARARAGAARRGRHAPRADARARRRPRRAGRRAVRRARHRRRDHGRRRRAGRRQPRLLGRARREGRLRARDVVALEQARPRRPALPAELRPRPRARGAARAPAARRARAAPRAPAAADRARVRRRAAGPAGRDRAEHVRRDGPRAPPPRRQPRRPRGLEPGAPPRDRRQRGRRAAARARAARPVRRLPVLRLPDRRRAARADRARRGRALRRGAGQPRRGGRADRRRRARARPRRRRRVRGPGGERRQRDRACGPTGCGPTSCTTRPRCR